MCEFVGTIAVCDTEPIAIEGLRSLLESVEGVRVVAGETSFAEGIEAVHQLQPGILVIDKAFGARTVMDCPRELRKLECQTAVVVWGAAIAETEALRFLQAGCSGVVRKTARLEAMLTCLREVARGATWMEEDLVREMGRPVRLSRNPLTAREMQVMELVERGLKNKDIGEELGIRTGTVKIHMKHIFEKTGVRGRYGLALSGLKEKGLLVPALLAV
jgi:DNA-binding NarL/FixJ family response regulator